MKFTIYQIYYVNDESINYIGSTKKTLPAQFRDYCTQYKRWQNGKIGLKYCIFKALLYTEFTILRYVFVINTTLKV